MMRALYRLRRSVALPIFPELVPRHAGGGVQGAPEVPVGAAATEETAEHMSLIGFDAAHRASGRDLSPGWWILPAIILGAAMWTGAALAISDAAGWL